MTAWRSRSEYDAVANALADRHYSRQTPGCGQVGPPGERIILVAGTAGRHAVWLSVYTDFPDDGLDAYRCSIFRNEGAGLSSQLIVEAMARTELEWGPPPEGWVTWVDTRRVASSNPGYCFKRAGWWQDHDWQPKRGRRGKIRLRADPVTAGARREQLELELAAT